MPFPFSRREFVQAVAAGAASSVFSSNTTSGESPRETAPEAFAIVDAHTHFYDPSRPQGVPFPSKDDKLLYRTVLPKDYRRLPVQHRVAATVVIEASPWIEDNQWILDLARDDPFIVGFVGNLPLGTADFQKHLKRFAANPLFRGVRIIGAAAREQLSQKQFISDLHALRDQDLELDLNGGPEFLADVAKVAAAVKDLRIVIDHVANVKIDGKAPPAEWVDGIRTAATNGSIFCKVSGLVEGSGRSDGSAPAAADFYRPILDEVWAAFGEDRLIFGSNWPVSERFAPLSTVQAIAVQYFAPHGERVLRKVFSSNAMSAYK